MIDHSRDTENELKQARRQIDRMERALKFHRLGLLLSVGLVITLLVIMAFGKRERFARAIIVDDQIRCLVPTQKDAETVRRRIIESARNGLPGEAFIKQKWEDAAIPADERPVLTVTEAVEELSGIVSVEVEAAMIRVEDVEVAAMATEELAEKALDALKSRYSGPEDGKLVSQAFKEDVTIRTCASAPDNISSDIRHTVELLSQGMRMPDEYIVVAGDYPQKIASARDMSVDELYRLNPGLKGRTLHPGEKLTVGKKVPPITVVTVSEVTREKEIAPPVERSESSAVPKGEERVASEGEPGKKQVRLRLTLHNEETVSQEAISEQIIQEPKPKRVLVGTGDPDTVTMRP